MRHMLTVAYPATFADGARVLSFSYCNPVSALENGVPVGSLTSIGGARYSRETNGKGRIMGNYTWGVFQPFTSSPHRNRFAFVFLSLCAMVFESFLNDSHSVLDGRFCIVSTHSHTHTHAHSCTQLRRHLLVAMGRTQWRRITAPHRTRPSK